MKYFFNFLCLICALGLSAQEICDDAVDNDGDGLIDLNDPDCDCLTIQPASLIPNPSFELMTCCPLAESQLNCANDWIQASTPTTDYVHTCGVLGNPFLGYEAPLPFPDGQGAIGFRDGKPGSENFKEYAGACLIEPLRKGVCYRLDFYVGFHGEIGSDIFPMAVFASPECSSLPFGDGDSNFGCPTNGPNWTELGEFIVEGQNEWVRVIFEFVADEDYNAIVLGPGCDINPNVQFDPYFYFDDLTIAAKSEFGVSFSEIGGDVCDGTVTLALDGDLDSDYQWYYNGIAIIGETAPVLGLVQGFEEGIYSATIITSDGCFLSESYLLEYPNLESVEAIDLCRGETYQFGSQTITDSGIYSETFNLGILCDSLATIDITFEPLESIEVLQYCQGETYEFGDQLITTTDIYENTFVLESGCDSIATVDITFEPLETFTTVEICEGDIYEFGPLQLSDEEVYINTFVLESGCDSIVTLDLIVNPVSETFLIDTICEGERYVLQNVDTEEPGTYFIDDFNQYGCDSMITVELVVLDGLGFLNMVDTVSLELGETVSVSPDNYSADARDFMWQNDIGLVLTDDEFLDDITPTGDMWFFLNIVNVNNCIAKDSVFLKVARNIRVFVPNVFTPSTQDANEAFTVGYNRSVTGFNSFNVYDRWGELVYKYEGSVDDYLGWDGYFNGREAESGVYTYHIEAQILDGTKEDYVGTVTLLR